MKGGSSLSAARAIAAAVSHSHFDRKDSFLLTYLTLSWSDLNLLGFKQSLGIGGMEETIHYILTGTILMRTEPLPSSHRSPHSQCSIAVRGRGPTAQEVFPWKTSKRQERSWGPLLKITTFWSHLCCFKLAELCFPVGMILAIFNDKSFKSL